MIRVYFFYFGQYVHGSSAMGKRLNYYAKCLVGGGLDLLVFSFPTIGFPNKGKYEGVSYEFLREFSFSNLPFLRNINYLFSFLYCVILSFKMLKKNDVVFLVGMGWFGKVLMTLVAHFRGAKLNLEINENPYSPEGGRLDPLWLRKINRFFTLNLVFPIADGFIVISDSLEALVKKYCSSRAKVIQVPILCDAFDVSKYPYSNVYTKYKPYIFHAGALSETKDGVKAVVRAFVIACSRTEKPLHFLFTQQKIYPKLNQYIYNVLAKAGLENRMVMVGKLTENELKCALRNAVLAIVNKPNNWQNNYNFPTKVGELLTLGVPIVASRSGEMQKYLQDGITALMFEPNNATEMADCIIEVLDNPALGYEIADNGRNLAKRFFHFKLFEDRLCHFFEPIN